MNTVSTERLSEIVSGFTGLEFCADSDRLDPAETLAIATELLALRQPDTRMEGGGEAAECTCEMLPPGFHMDACPMHKRSAPPLNRSPNPEHVEGDVLSVGDLVGRLLEPVDWAHFVSDDHAADYATLLHEAATSIHRAERERNEALGKLALIVDSIVYSDSYGVPGSDFQCCHLCSGGGAPGVPFEHDERCPVRQVERDYEQWFADIQSTEDALRETEDRATAAEAQLEEARKVFNDAFDFLGGVDAADEIREAILPFLASLGEKQDAE